MSPEELQQLVERLRASDGEALGPYLDARRPHLIAYIDRKLGTALRTKVEPDDIFQEVAASAVRALPDYELGTRDPFGWLCDLADRRIVDAHRRFFAAEKRSADREVSGNKPASETRTGGLIDLLVQSMTTPSKLFSRNARVMRMFQALEQLPDDARQALRMRYLQGLPSKEIAKQIGRTDGATRVLLTRSLDKLQQIMGDDAPHR